MMMPDEDTSSDTLREKAEAATDGPWRRKGPAFRRGGSGYVATVDGSKASARGENLDFIAAADPDTVLKLLDERDEARADRDQLHDALTRLRAHRNCSCSGDEEELYECPTCSADRALREVERGDTVDKIRREAFEEAAEKVENLGQAHFYCTQHERHEGDGGASPPPNGKCWQNQADVADAIRALAGADDQEDE